MSDLYGPDYITIVDEDGKEFELEILSSIEVNGIIYHAVIPASLEEGEAPEVSILKSIEEDGEPILCAIEDPQEHDSVYNQIMEQLYEESDDE